MIDQKPSIQQAAIADIPAIREVLRSAKLPDDSVDNHIDDFFVARDATGVVGCVGLERYDDTGILRSLAVAPAFRGRDLGVSLARAVIERGRGDKLRTIVLLTETAERFFADKLGFEVVERSVVSPLARESWQFTGAVCRSATCMKLELH